MQVTDWIEQLYKVSFNAPPYFLSRKIYQLYCEKLKGLLAYVEELVKWEWRFEDIWGCHPTHPLQRYDYMGLFFLLKGRRVRGFKKGGIILETPTKAQQTFTPLKKNLTGIIYLWDLPGRLESTRNV